MEKQRWEKPEKRKEEKRLSEKRKSQKKEDAGARKGRKVADHFVFPVICGSGWSKSTLAKAVGAEARLEMKVAGRCCGAKHMFKSKCQRWTNFGSCDVEKAHALFARSTCRSQNLHSTSTPDHLWKL